MLEKLAWVGFDPTLARPSWLTPHSVWTLYQLSYQAMRANRHSRLFLQQVDIAFELPNYYEFIILTLRVLFCRIWKLFYSFFWILRPLIWMTLPKNSIGRSRLLFIYLLAGLILHRAIFSSFMSYQIAIIFKCLTYSRLCCSPFSPAEREGKPTLDIRRYRRTDKQQP